MHPCYRQAKSLVYAFIESVAGQNKVQKSAASHYWIGVSCGVMVGAIDVEVVEVDIVNAGSE
jgi:hypothetical protein